jgi:hypothetical protein
MPAGASEALGLRARHAEADRADDEPEGRQDTSEYREGSHGEPE